MFGADSLLSGGVSLLGGYMNNSMAMDRQEQAQQFNAQQSAKQMAFQEHMSETAHQREANDMQAAGLNRILSAGGGRGASSPAGAMASSPAPPPVHDMLSPAVHTAMATSKLREELNNMREQNKVLQHEQRLKDVQATNVVSDTSRKIAETSKINDENAIIVENLMDAKTKAAKAKIEHDQLNNPAYKILRQTGNIGEEVQRGSSALSNIPALINAGSNARKNKYIRTGD